MYWLVLTCTTILTCVVSCAPSKPGTTPPSLSIVPQTFYSQAPRNVPDRHIDVESPVKNQTPEVRVKEPTHEEVVQKTEDLDRKLQWLLERTEKPPRLKLPGE